MGVLCEVEVTGFETHTFGVVSARGAIKSRFES